MKKRMGGLLLAAFFLGSSAWGVPPHPKLIERLKEEGKWEKFKSYYKNLGDYDQPNPQPYRFTFSPQTASGAVPPETLKVVVIYAAPNNRPPSADGVNVTQAQLQAILFGSNPTGNMSQYYSEISLGQTVVVGDVYGPYTLPQNNAFYTFGNSGIPATNFTNDALTAADPTVNFSQYDGNGDGWIDGLFIVHTGPGAEETGQTTDIWSHAGSISTRNLDGKLVGNYAIQPEQQAFPAGPIQIGVFCHESGHSLFGLPDLYDLDNSSEGTGAWCLMGSGNYQNNSRTPVHMSSWCKKQVGWITPTNLAANQNGVSFPTTQYTPAVHRLWTGGAASFQYFLVENRQQKGFDAFLPGAGLLIWHIDEEAGSNTNENRYMVGLMQADGLRNLNLGQNRGDGGDPFPGSSNNRNFDEFSNPHSKTNVLNQPTQVAVFNVSNSDSVMTANLEVVYGRPRVTAFTSSIDDASGNGNGIPEEGETVNLYLSFTNAWLAATNWNVKVRIKDTSLTVLDSTAVIANLTGLGASTSTSPDAVTFGVPAGLPRSRLDSVFVYGWNSDSSYAFSAVYLQQIGPTQVLLVDDDHNRALENYYKAPFDTILAPTATWSVFSQGVPPLGTLQLYPNVIWFTANDSSSLLNAARLAVLKSYMDSGGNLVLTGQGIAQSLAGGADSSFLRDYFHCRYKASQSPPIFGVGVPGNPISSAAQVILIGGGGAGNQTQTDQLDFIDGRADKVYTYSDVSNNTSGPIGAVAFADSSRRALFAGFGFEAINSNAVVQGGTKRSVIFSKILDWLVGSSTPNTGLAIPYISLDAEQFNFSARINDPLPAPDTLGIENTGGGGMAWTATLNPPVSWLAVTPDNGVQNGAVAVAVTSTNLSPGTHTDTVVISSSGAYNDPRKVTVRLTLTSTRGDMNSDGLFTSADVVLHMNCAFLGIGSCDPAITDINCDGVASSGDVVLLLNVVFLGALSPC